MRADPTSLQRRRMLAGSAAAFAAAGLAGWSRGAAAAGETPAPAAAAAAPKPLPPYVSWKDPASLIVHSGTTIETRRSSLRHQRRSRRPNSSTSATTCRRPTRPSSPTATPGRWRSKA